MNISCVQLAKLGVGGGEMWGVGFGVGWLEVGQEERRRGQYGVVEF